MFDILAGLFALGNAAIDATAITLAVRENQKIKEQEVFVAPPKPCFPNEVKKEEKPVFYFEHHISCCESVERYNESMKPTGKKMDFSPLEKWIFEHTDLIMEIVKKPGVHVIPNKVLGNVSRKELIDALFVQKGVDQIHEIPEGIEITTIIR